MTISFPVPKSFHVIDDDKQILWLIEGIKDKDCYCLAYENDFYVVAFTHECDAHEFIANHELENFYKPCLVKVKNIKDYSLFYLDSEYTVCLL